ncbi:glutamine synthetase III family protein [Beduini massiliensis]|uniref:glutamine synthetase III family protein n=1 Tax=Beduini massiliensis TaxID=1585974 RepID=UPI00059A7F87|nr:glutamine synthetase III [Beduini massiliensis]
MREIKQTFGSMVFNETVMQERLPKEVYRKLQKTMNEGKVLDVEIASAVANAMKDWAIEKGATHYTHWFQPMTGITAEKHEAFITPGNGGILLEFSGKELIKGEPDASSFPNGGLRATFEARGYTTWDPTSYAFIKDKTLCIPTAFCTFDGLSLDKKTPLLRSMELIHQQAMRIIRLFDHEGITRVTTTVGSEQEYFLVDRHLYEQRPDLVLCKRTLFGAPAPRGQELEDHYFGMINERVKAYMQEVDEELWKLGVFAKTEHKEVAPAQFELAPIFTTANIAADHNQLMMEVLQKVALKHGYECLLHEKPYEGINGSGKHNNWSIVTNNGINLLEPGKTPEKNARFLLFLTAIIKAVDDYQDLLRVSVATAGNDHRLGANEAPPAIVSIFLGTELTNILEALEQDLPYNQTYERSMQIGVDVLPEFPKDTTDRNRTSPFAFTGNKFEFRMLGSSLSISCPNIILNTIVADALSQFADRLEKSTDFKQDLNKLIKETLHQHKRIIFNGNGYGEEWVEEAKQRGLLNIENTAKAIPYYIADKNVKLFTKYQIYTKEEMFARDEILFDTYSKTLHIEANTMIRMASQDILPAAIRYQKELLTTLQMKKQLSLESDPAERPLYDTLSKEIKDFTLAIQQVKEILETTKGLPVHQISSIYADKLIPLMDTLRQHGDHLEEMVDRQTWPYPQYTDLLYRI